MTDAVRCCQMRLDIARWHRWGDFVESYGVLQVWHGDGVYQHPDAYANIQVPFLGLLFRVETAHAVSFDNFISPSDIQGLYIQRCTFVNLCDLVDKLMETIFSMDEDVQLWWGSLTKLDIIRISGHSTDTSFSFILKAQEGSCFLNWNLTVLLISFGSWQPSKS